MLVALLGAAWLYLGKGDTVEVLVVDRPVAVGQVIAAEDLTTGQVAGAGEAVPVGRQDEVIGQRAAVGLVPGQLVTANAVTSDPVPAGEERMVALRLADGRVPATVAQGERVSVLAVPPAGDVANDNTLKKPTVLAESVLVHAVKTGADGAVVITVRVPDTEADAVAAFSAAERVTIVQAPAAAPGTGGE